jgi:hypothetical protein
MTKEVFLHLCRENTARHIVENPNFSMEAALNASNMA